MKKLKKAFGSLKSLSADGSEDLKISIDRSLRPIPRKSVSASITNEIDGVYLSYDDQSLQRLSVVNYIDPLRNDDKLFTKLHKWAFLGNASKVKKYLKKVDIDAQDCNRRTALHLCSSAGHVEVLISLLNAKANAELKDRDERTPIYRATENGHLQVVQMLLQYRVQINVVDIKENTPLHVAAQTGSRDITDMFLDYGLNPELPNIYGQTAVHVAASNSQIDAMKVLVSKEVNVNIEDKEGVTAIMLAAKYGCKPMVEILLTAGADATQQDCSGWTAPSYAKYAGFDDIHKYLVNYIQEELELSPADTTMRIGGNTEDTSLENFDTGTSPTSGKDFEEVPLNISDDSWNDDSDDLSLKPKLDLNMFLVSRGKDESISSRTDLTLRKSLSASVTSLGPPKPPRSFASTSSLHDKLDSSRSVSDNINHMNNHTSVTAGVASYTKEDLDHSGTTEEDITFSDGKSDIFPSIEENGSLLTQKKVIPLLNDEIYDLDINQILNAASAFHDDDLKRIDTHSSTSDNERKESNVSESDKLRISKSIDNLSVVANDDSSLLSPKKVSSIYLENEKEEMGNSDACSIKYANNELSIIKSNSSSMVTSTDKIISRNSSNEEVIKSHDNPDVHHGCINNPVLISCQTALNEIDRCDEEKICPHGTLGRKDTLQQVEEMWECNAKIFHDDNSLCSGNEISNSEVGDEPISSLRKVFFGDSKERVFPESFHEEFTLDLMTNQLRLNDNTGPISLDKNDLSAACSLSLYHSDSDEESTTDLLDQKLPISQDALEHLVRKLRTLLNKEHEKGKYFESLMVEMKVLEDNLLEKLEHSENLSFDFEKANLKLSSGLEQVEFMNEISKDETSHALLCYQEAIKQLSTLRKEKESLKLSMVEKNLKLENAVNITSARSHSFRNINESSEVTCQKATQNVQTQTLPLKEVDFKDESSSIDSDFLQFESCSASTQTLRCSSHLKESFSQTDSIATSEKGTFMNKCLHVSDGCVQTDIISLQDQEVQANIFTESSLQLIIDSQENAFQADKLNIENCTQTSLHMEETSVQTNHFTGLFTENTYVQTNISGSFNIEKAYDRTSCPINLHTEDSSCQTSSLISLRTVEASVQTSDLINLHNEEASVQMNYINTVLTEDATAQTSLITFHTKDASVQTNLLISLHTEDASIQTSSLISPHTEDASVQVSCLINFHTKDAYVQTNDEISLHTADASVQTNGLISLRTEEATAQMNNLIRLHIADTSVNTSGMINIHTEDASVQTNGLISLHTEEVSVQTNDLITLYTTDSSVKTSDMINLHTKEASIQTKDIVSITNHIQAEDIPNFGFQKLLQPNPLETEVSFESSKNGFELINLQGANLDQVINIYSEAVKKHSSLLVDKEIQTEKGTEILSENVNKQIVVLSSHIDESKRELKDALSNSVLELLDSNKMIHHNGICIIKEHAAQLQDKYLDFKSLTEAKIDLFEEHIKELKNPDALISEVQSSRKLLDEISQQMSNFSKLEAFIAEKLDSNSIIFSKHSSSIENLLTETLQIPKQLSNNLSESVEKLNSVIGSKIEKQKELLSDEVNAIDKNMNGMYLTLKTLCEDSRVKNISMSDINENMKVLLINNDASRNAMKNFYANEEELIDRLQEVILAIEVSTSESNKVINENLKVLIQSLDETVSENFQIVQNFLQNLQSSLLTKVTEMKEEEIEVKNFEVNKLSQQIEDVHSVLHNLKISYEASNLNFSDALFDNNIIEAIRGGNDQALSYLKSQNNSLLNLVEGCKDLLEKVERNQNEPGYNQVLEDLRNEVKYYLNEYKMAESKLKLSEVQSIEMAKELSLKLSDLKVVKDDKINLEAQLKVLMKEKEEDRKTILHLQVSNEALQCSHDSIRKEICNQKEIAQKDLGISQNFNTENLPLVIDSKVICLQNEKDHLNRELNEALGRNSLLSSEIKSLSECIQHQRNDTLDETKKQKITIENHEIRIRDLQKRLLQSEVSKNPCQLPITEDLEQQFFNEIKSMKESKKAIEFSLQEKRNSVTELQVRVSDLEAEREDLDSQLASKICLVSHLRKGSAKQQKVIQTLKQSLEEAPNDNITLEELKMKMSEFETEIASKQNMVLNLQERLRSLGQEKYDLIKKLSLQKNDNLCVELVLQEKEIVIEASKHLKSKLETIARNISDEYIPKTQLEFLYRDVESYFEAMYSLRKNQWDEMAMSKYKVQEERNNVLLRKTNDLEQKLQFRNDAIEELQSRMSLTERNCHLWRSRYDQMFREFHKMPQSPRTMKFTSKNKSEVNHRHVPSNEVDFQSMINDIDHILKTPYDESLYINSVYHSPQSSNNSLSSAYQLNISNSSGIPSPSHNWNLSSDFLQTPITSPTRFALPNNLLARDSQTGNDVNIALHSTPRHINVPSPLRK